MKRLSLILSSKCNIRRSLVWQSTDVTGCSHNYLFLRSLRARAKLQLFLLYPVSFVVTRCMTFYNWPGVKTLPCQSITKYKTLVMSLNEANQFKESLPLWCSSRYCLAPLCNALSPPDMLRVLGVMTQDSKVTPSQIRQRSGPASPATPGGWRLCYGNW